MQSESLSLFISGGTERLCVGQIIDVKLYAEFIHTAGVQRLWAVRDMLRRQKARRFIKFCR